MYEYCTLILPRASRKICLLSLVIVMFKGFKGGPHLDPMMPRETLPFLSLYIYMHVYIYIYMYISIYIYIHLLRAKRASFSVIWQTQKTQ